MTGTEEEEEYEVAEGPTTALIYLNFWRDNDQDEPIQTHKGFDIPIPEIDDQIELNDIQVDSSEGVSLTDGGDTDVEPIGAFNVVDKYYQYTDIEWADKDNVINPPLVAVDVYLDEIEESADN